MLSVLDTVVLLLGTNNTPTNISCDEPEEDSRRQLKTNPQIVHGNHLLSYPPTPPNVVTINTHEFQTSHVMSEKKTLNDSYTNPVIFHGNHPLCSR